MSRPSYPDRHRPPFNIRWPDEYARPAEHEATFTLDKQTADARRDMGPARWAELNAEWRS